MKTSRKDARIVPFLEEVFAFAQRLPYSTWALYFCATFPFVIGLLYFWFDMANDAFAHERLSIGATILTFLFITMKTGHVIFARQVTQAITGHVPETRPQTSAIVVNQTIIQATGLFALPVAMLLVVPFASVYAFYQNVSVLDDGSRPIRELMREAWSHAKRDPMQNHLMLWLLCPYVVMLASAFLLVLIPIMRVASPEWIDWFLYVYAFIGIVVMIPLCPFGIIVALNIGAAVVFLPSLLKTLFGVDTLFSIAPSMAFSPSFLALVAGLTYLVLDPLIKTAYALRCFRASAHHSGQDIRSALFRIRRVVATMLAIAMFATALTSEPVLAQSTESSSSVSSNQLDEAIDDTLQERKYAWRLPRSRPEMKDTGVFASLGEGLLDTGTWLLKQIRAVVKWIQDFFDGRELKSSTPSTINEQSMQGMVVGLTVVLICILGYIAIHVWRKTTVIQVSATPVTLIEPDLNDENTTADELPSNEWARLARELLEQGNIRLAMRAYFFAGLAQLSHRKLILLAAHKSNREYQRELKRIAHTEVDLFTTFS